MLPNQEITTPDVSLKCLRQPELLLSGEKYKRGQKIQQYNNDDDDDQSDENNYVVDDDDNYDDDGNRGGGDVDDVDDDDDDGGGLLEIKSGRKLWAGKT